MIKCSLIDITTDNRAVICINEDTEKCEVKSVKIVDIDFELHEFSDGNRVYSFDDSHPH